MAAAVRTKVFWSRGSQAVRLPEHLRIEGNEVLVRRRGRAVLIEPVPDPGWDDFWEQLLPLRDTVRRWNTKAT